MKNFVWRWFFVFYKIQYRTIGARYSTPNKRKYTHTNELFLGIVNAIDSFISCSARFETLWNKTWSALFCFLIDNRWFGKRRKKQWSQYVRGHYFKCHFIEQCDICCIHLLHFIMKSKISMFIFIQCCLLYYFFICSLILTFLC